MPLVQCPEFGCRVLVESGRCDKHRKQQQQRNEQRRASARSRGYSAAWDKAARAYLASNPLCVYCHRAGRLVPSQCVDHVEPHGGNMQLFWDVHNWAAACLECNSSKGDRTPEQWLGKLERVGR